MLNHRLAQLTAAFNHIHDVVDDLVFQPHHHVKVTQPDVRVDNDDFLTHRRQRHAEIGGG